MSPAKSRGTILNKIKQALSKQKINLQEPNFSSPVFTRSEEQDLSILFAENFIKTKGEFVFCETEEEFASTLQVVVKKKKLNRIFAWEEKIHPMLNKAKVSFSAGEKEFLKADTGITFCEGLISRTGSVLTSSGSRAGRRLSIYPPTHIVIAYTSQIVYDIEDALSAVRKKYEGNLPSMISLVTGPSRTADIEKTLVLGAHGPKELILFLIDDAQH